MFTRILVAVDGSNNADEALTEAIAIVKDQHAQLRIVHVIDRAPRSIGLILPDLGAFADAALDSGRKVLGNAERAAREAGVVAEGVLAEIGRNPCPMSSKILSEAADWPADLIVIGAPERAGIRHSLTESVAGDVVHLARVPVLLVHGGQGPVDRGGSRVERLSRVVEATRCGPAPVAIGG